jgi:hypothetical protein
MFLWGISENEMPGGAHVPLFKLPHIVFSSYFSGDTLQVPARYPSRITGK